MTGQSGNRAIGQREPVGSDFTKIALWQESQSFAEKVSEVVADLPNDRVAGVIGNQLIRAAGSISANVAEGYGRYSPGAYRNHLSIARGSAFEAQSWIDLLKRRKYLKTDLAIELLASCSKVQSMLTTRMRSLESSGTVRVREDGPEWEQDK